MPKKKFQLTTDNYFSVEADMAFCSASQYKDFCGCIGRPACEAAAMAKMRGEIEQEQTVSMMVGSYVDAHFSGTLDKFKADHPEIFVSRGENKGQLKSEYRQAEAMIERAERDKLFMKYLDGEKQKIMTGEIEGVPFKIMIDSFDNKRITDLKTVESLSKTFYVADSNERLNFCEYWAYDAQLAIYREVVRQATGEVFPCYIAAISKNKTGTTPHPRISIIEIPPMVMDERLEEIKANVTRIQDLKNGLYDPVRCELCDYCADTQVLTDVISMDELLGEIRDVRILQELFYRE